METSRVEQSGVRVGEQGRIVIPARIRERLDIVAGDELVARIDGGRLLLEKRENVLRRLRERFSAVPEGVSLSDELILERREEARREEER